MIEVLFIAAMFCTSEVKAQNVQISDKPIEANKAKKLLVFTRAEFTSLVLGKTEEKIIQLLGKPDHVEYLSGLCLGVGLGSDFWFYQIRIKNAGFEDRDVTACIAINGWTLVSEKVSFLENGKTPESPPAATQ